MIQFLARMRRRLRLVWAWATTAWVAPAVMCVALALVALGWLRPWGWPERGAVAVTVTAVALIAVGTVVQRLPLPAVARAADRGLATGDAFGAALQFESLDEPFGSRIRDRADTLAQGADPAQAAPVVAYGRRWLVTGVVAVAAFGLAVAPNPQDDVRADRAAAAALIHRAADELDTAADDLDETEAGAEVAEELRRLADELRRTDDLEEAQRLLDEARAALDAARPDDFASRRAATEGLERGLTQRPLTEAGGSAAEQLGAVGQTLDDLSADEQAALVERLEALAETQEAGNPAVADAVRQAADRLAAGNVTGAQAALGEAAAAQAGANNAVTGQLASGQASTAVAQAQANLTNAGQGQGQGQGQGSGSGGAGGGSPQGNVGGADGGTGQGQGGVGRPGGTDQNRTDTNDGATVIDPATVTDGEDTPLGGTPTGPAGEVVGRGDGPTTAGPARVPLRDIVGHYADRATATAANDRLPPGQQQLVGDYFDLLSR